MPLRVRLTADAEADLQGIYLYIGEKASPGAAKAYAARILEFLSKLEMFPERGTRRDEIRPGLRMIGFERRVTVAFIAQPEEVVVLRILYAGRQFEGE